MMDYFHFETYQKAAVNYNRDLEMFPVVKRIIELHYLIIIRSFLDHQLTEILPYHK